MKGLYLFQRYLPFTQLIWFVLSGQSDVFSISLCSIPFYSSHGGHSDDEWVSVGELR